MDRPNTTLPEDAVLLGQFGKTFQLEGGLRFYGLGSAERGAIRTLEEVFVEGLGKRAVKRVRVVGEQLIMYLEGVHTVEAAKSLVNRALYAPPDALPSPEEGDVYIDLLIGLPVSVDGEDFGEVVEFVEAGGQDLLVIERDSEEILVPLQADYVHLSEEGVAILDAPEGLFELHRPQ